MNRRIFIVGMGPSPHLMLALITLQRLEQSVISINTVAALKEYEEKQLSFQIKDYGLSKIAQQMEQELLQRSAETKLLASQHKEGSFYVPYRSVLPLHPALVVPHVRRYRPRSSLQPSKRGLFSYGIIAL